MTLLIEKSHFELILSLYSKRIIRRLLKKYEEFLSARNMTVKEGIVTSKISKAKAKSITADMFAAEVEDKLREKGTTSLDAILFPLDVTEKITAEIYIEYERLLRQNNSLDFDDLLVFGVKMFKAHKNAVTWCRHVLVDELCVLFPVHGFTILITFKKSRYKYYSI